MDVIKKDLKELKKRLDKAGISFEDKIVLITGGAGFLGSWLCDILVEQNAKVLCLDNLLSGKLENIKHHLNKENFTFIEHDISKPIDIDKKVDIIFHFASRASPLEFDKFPIQILKANTLGTWITLGIAKKHRARYIFASTSEVYGDAQVIPTPESYNGNVNPLGIRGCYDESKRCGEAFVMAYHRQHSLDTRIVRIFNTYGPRMRAEGYYGRVVPRFISQALSNKPLTVFGTGEQTRSFTYVIDEIEGILRLAFFDNLSGEVVNIGNNEETKIIDLANLIIKLTNSSSGIEFHPLPKDDPRRRCPDISKAVKLLGWKPTIKLEEGLKRTIKWFKSS